RAKILAPRGETHDQEEILQEPEMTLGGGPADSQLLSCRCHVQQLTCLRRDMAQEIRQCLTLADPAQLDSIAFDGRSDEVVKPASPGRTRSPQRERHPPGAHAIDILSSRRRRRRVGTHDGIGIRRERLEQVLPHSAELPLGEWPDDERMKASGQCLRCRRQGILPRRPRDDRRPRVTPFTVQPRLERVKNVRDTLILVDAERSPGTHRSRQTPLDRLAHLDVVEVDHRTAHRSADPRSTVDLPTDRGPCSAITGSSCTCSAKISLTRRGTNPFSSLPQLGRHEDLNFTNLSKLTWQT